MVSSSKLRRAEKNTKQFKPYMDKMQDAITAVAGSNKILAILCLKKEM